MRMGEMEIETPSRFHLAAVRIASVNTSGSNTFGRGPGEKGSLLSHWWYCTLVTGTTENN